MPSGLIPELVIVAIASIIAGVSLFGDRLPRSWLRAASLLDRVSLNPLRSLHSGKVSDYVTWLTVGVAAFGLALALLTGMLARHG